MLAYIGPIVALLTGVVGIFYAKTGERQPLNRVSGVLLAFIVIAGAASLYGVKQAASDAAAKTSAAEAKEAEARKEASARAREAQRERVRADSLRGMLLATTFEPQDRPAKGLLLLDLPAPENASDEQDDGLWPLLGPGVRASSITFKVEGVIDIDYRLTRAGDGFDIAAHWYNQEERVCRLTSATGHAFTEVPGSSCAPRPDYHINALLEQDPGARSLIVNLQREMFLKTYSRIEQTQRSEGSVGTIVIEAETETAVPGLLASARKLVPYLKFFRPYPQPRGRDEDDCYTALLATFETRVTQTGPRTITIDIPRMASFDLNFCEIRMNS